MRDLWKSIAETSGARIYSLLLGMITLPITARWLGPEGRGIFAAVTTWVGLVGTFGGLSLGQVAFHRATAMREKRWLPSTLGSLLAIAAATTLLGWAGIAGLYVATAGAAFGHIALRYVWLGVIVLPFALWEQYGSYLLMAVDQLRVYNRAQIAGRTVGLLLTVILLAVLGWGVTGAFITAIAAQLTVAAWGMRRLLQEGVPRPRWPVIRELLGGGLRLHMNTLGTFLFTTSDILMVQYYRGARETGYYQLAVQLLNMLLILPQAASLVLYSHAASLGADAAWKYNRRILLGITAGMIAISGAAALLAPYIIPLLAGRAFGPSVKVFQISLLAILGMTISFLMAPQWISRGLFWQASALSVAAGLLNVAGNVVLIPRFGMYAAAWTTVGCYCIVAGVNLFMAVWVNRRAVLAVGTA